MTILDHAVADDLDLPRALSFISVRGISNRIQDA